MLYLNFQPRKSIKPSFLLLCTLFSFNAISRKNLVMLESLNTPEQLCPERTYRSICAKTLRGTHSTLKLTEWRSFNCHRSIFSYFVILFDRLFFRRPRSHPLQAHTFRAYFTSSGGGTNSMHPTTANSAFSRFFTIAHERSTSNFLANVSSFTLFYFQISTNLFNTCILAFKCTP